jgi:hypothetical protein
MALMFLVRATLLMTLSASPSLPTPASDTDRCLPSGIQSTDVVSVGEKRGKQNHVTVVTVAQKLKDLKARCRRGKLVDSSGREIRFYQMVGCWGNPPDDYQQQLARQDKELARLRKRYRVIEMTCDPSGDMRMRSGSPPANPMNSTL